MLLATLAALAVGGCARQQQTYYVIDPNTGQPVPVMSQQQQYAQAPNPTPSQPADSRGLFSSSPAYAQQTYSQQNYPQQTYAQAVPQTYAQPQAQPQAVPGERGLFNSRTRSQQNYAPQLYVQQPQPQQPYIAQYGTQPQYAPQPRYAPQPQYAPRPAPQFQQGGPYAAAPANGGQGAYSLDSGDKLRVVVFGQDGITNSYMVDAGGNISLPLIGTVPARGYSPQQLSRMIAERLKQGFVRDPSVNVDVEAYRPFFILGEVTNPGQYPYVPNMTAETAIAIAGGFAPRAAKGKVEISRNVPGQQFKGEVPLGFPLRPGDTILVKERWF